MYGFRCVRTELSVCLVFGAGFCTRGKSLYKFRGLLSLLSNLTFSLSQLGPTIIINHNYLCVCFRAIKSSQSYFRSFLSMNPDLDDTRSLWSVIFRIPPFRRRFVRVIADWKRVQDFFARWLRDVLRGHWTVARLTANFAEAIHERLSLHQACGRWTEVHGWTRMRRDQRPTLKDRYM